MLQARGAVESYAQFLAFCIRALEVLVGPFFVFTDKLNIAVAGFRHSLQTLFERQIAKDSPQHHRQFEWGSRKRAMF